MLTYCVLIPARNEAERIGATIRAARSRPEVAMLIVVDDASRDDTARIAAGAGADDVVRLDRNAGKGGALTAGIKAAPDGCDAFVFLDADLGDSASECVKLIAPIERDEADMTIGMLPPDPDMVAAGETGGGFGIAVGMARGGLLKRTGQQFEQPLSGQRALRRSVVEAVGGEFAGGFGIEVGLTIAAMSHGFRVREVETMFRHRVTGADLRASLHRARQMWDVAAALRRG